MHLIFHCDLTPSALLFPLKIPPILKPMPYVPTLLFILFLLLQAPQLAAQNSQLLALSTESPIQLVRQVVQRGQRLRDDPKYWSYRETIQKDGRLETHVICQTASGTLDRLIALNNQPISAEQQRREDSRLQAFLASPAEIHRERLKQREDTAKQYRMFATFPDAFIFRFAGTEGSLVKLEFEPNLQFVPNTRQEEVFHHLEGTMWIDPEQKQLVRLEGRLTSEVRFAGGLLGHLDENGVFSVRFKEVAPNQWLMAELKVNMGGRALFFKTISVQEQREFSDYQRMPGNMTLYQAAELLEKNGNSANESAAN